MSKYSKKAQTSIGRKMHVMKGEKKSQEQKVAIALSEARAKGLKVPKENPHGFHDQSEIMEKQGKGMEVKPGSAEPLHHLPKEMKQRTSDYTEKMVYNPKQLHSSSFLTHPQIKVAKERK